MVGIIPQNNGGYGLAPVVFLFNHEEIRPPIPTLLLHANSQQIAPEHELDQWPDYPVQGKTFNPIVLRQVCLKIQEML